MESFVDGTRTIEFGQVTGEVMGSDKRSETHVSGGGGGGGSYQGTGYTAPVHISSTVVTKHEFWLKLPDGQERSVQLSGHDIPLRVGQRITLISARRAGDKDAWYVILLNHNERAHRFLYKGRDLYRMLKMRPAQRLLGCLMLVGIIAVATFSWKLSAVLLVAYVALSVARDRNIRAQIRRLDEHMERLAQSCYSRA